MYKTPELVRKNAEFHLKRVDPQSGWADDTLRDAFRDSISTEDPELPEPTSAPPPLSGGEIAGIVVSVVIGLPLLVFAILCAIFRSLPKFQWPPWEWHPDVVDADSAGTNTGLATAGAGQSSVRSFPNKKS